MWRCGGGGDRGGGGGDRGGGGGDMGGGEGRWSIISDSILGRFPNWLNQSRFFSGFPPRFPLFRGIIINKKYDHIDLLV